MADWTALARELDMWAQSGQTATFWWRDDDAGADAVKLKELLDLRQDLGVPLAMAVVPDWLTADVASLITGSGDIHVLQHGVAHADHSGGRGRRIELCAGALPSGLRQALIRSRNVLRTSFPSSLIEVMVPPWNRIDEAVLSILAGSGFLGLSILGPRRGAREHGLVVNNVHIDIIDWKVGRRFAGDEACLEASVRHLEDRRHGVVDSSEATGLMTHHLVHDTACHAFIDRFVHTVARHPAGLWLSAGAVFGASRRTDP
ncbi:MAG: hypothetical protein OXU19_03045 [bacterium]|nr:hypothetical protein [bacterium]MDE0243029.1 hypothetical protein [bacterium]MDE0416080.1 hypothetical protein [bacterium]